MALALGGIETSNLCTDLRFGGFNIWKDFADMASDEYVTVGNTTEDALGRTLIYDAENKQIEVIGKTGVTSAILAR